MKTVLEEIVYDRSSSISLLVNPDLRDFFFWHFHPELELVFIDGVNGTRHVGNHLSKYEGNDLVFIGSYIPHLNFDYGVKGDYEKIVVHLHPNFLQTTWDFVPEMAHIEDLLDQSRWGVAFGRQTKSIAIPMIRELPFMPTFERFTYLLRILEILAKAEDRELLHETPVDTRHSQKAQKRLQEIYSYVDEHHHEKIEIAQIADHVHLTKEAFCRNFKKMTKLTFTDFVNHYRIDIAKKMLLQDYKVGEVCFACGFDSLSYFNRTFKKICGENPLSFKKGHS